MGLKSIAVIPCYRVKKHIVGVVSDLLQYVDFVVAVDDKCPEQSGQWLEKNMDSNSFQVLYHQTNQGVGGAVKTGLKYVIENNYDVAIKVDGDGQMNPKYIPTMVSLIEKGQADYVKGNRFYQINFARKMPLIRLLGNLSLSFLTKISSGYYNLMDPTNGFVAIHSNVLKYIDLDKVANRYFFESDMLFRLNLLSAKVTDLPMPAIYADEKSSMKLHKILITFPLLHASRFFKRLFYNYFFRDINQGSLYLLLFLLTAPLGLGFTGYFWYRSIESNVASTTGTVMIPALLLLSSLQFLIAFFNYDLTTTPKSAVWEKLKCVE